MRTLPPEARSLSGAEARSLLIAEIEGRRPLLATEIRNKKARSPAPVSSRPPQTCSVRVKGSAYQAPPPPRCQEIFWRRACFFAPPKPPAPDPQTPTPDPSHAVSNPHESPAPTLHLTPVLRGARRSSIHLEGVTARGVSRPQRGRVLQPRVGRRRRPTLGNRERSILNPGDVTIVKKVGVAPRDPPRLVRPLRGRVLIPHATVGFTHGYPRNSPSGNMTPTTAGEHDV
ncbi:MAG: hypothetical protein FLDDKLPJ_01490 [Phycisphaerae bacterium]|nr:hypothetical protein [Phycisphaerae bacterium]